MFGSLGGLGAAMGATNRGMCQSSTSTHIKSKSKSRSRAGMTVMGDATGQQFSTVGPLRDVDPSKLTRISLRLVAPSVDEVRPLQTHLNMDPPRI